MSNSRHHVWFEVVLGALLGLSLGVGMLYGLVEGADWIVERTHHELSTDR